MGFDGFLMGFGSSSESWADGCCYRTVINGFLQFRCHLNVLFGASAVIAAIAWLAWLVWLVPR